MPDTKKKLDIGYTQQLELELCKDGLWQLIQTLGLKVMRFLLGDSHLELCKSQELQTNEAEGQSD